MLCTVQTNLKYNFLKKCTNNFSKITKSQITVQVIFVANKYNIIILLNFFKKLNFV